jgi:thioredoxin 1
MVNVKEIKSYDEFNSFKNLDDNNLKIVKIGAEWCGPCRVMEETIHGLDENKITGVLFGAVNIDDDNVEQIAIDYSIRNIPVLLFFKNSELVYKNVGSINAETIYNIINEYK